MGILCKIKIWNCMLFLHLYKFAWLHRIWEYSIHFKRWKEGLSGLLLPYFFISIIHYLCLSLPLTINCFSPTHCAARLKRKRSRPCFRCSQTETDSHSHRGHQRVIFHTFSDLKDQKALTTLLRQGESTSLAGLADWERETTTDTRKGAVSLHY